MTPLRTEEGLVGGAGDDLRALLKEEVVADDPQHVGPMSYMMVVGMFCSSTKLPDGGHRFLVQHHALAEDDELGLILLDDLLGLLHVDLVDVILADGGSSPRRSAR